MFFKKYHIVKITHLKYNNLYRNIQLYKNEDLISFLNKYYNLTNFKLEIAIHTSKINIAEMITIYNLNPYKEDLKLSDMTVSDTKSFMKKYNINEYELEHYIYKDTSTEEEAYKIYMRNDNENFDTYLFPDFEKFYENIKKIKDSGIVHKYQVEPSIISVENYLKVLNLYGTFENRNFKDSFEINQYINDMRELSAIVLPDNKKIEIT